MNNFGNRKMFIVALVFVVLSLTCGEATESFASLQIDTSKVLSRTSAYSFGCVGMDWWPSSKCDYGSCPWAETSMLNADLNNKKIQNAVRSLSPVYLRLGGSLSDFVRYEDGERECRSFSEPTNTTRLGYEIGSGCLTMKRWDELNDFCVKTNCSLLFDVGALIGRTNSTCPAGTDCHAGPVLPCCTNWTGNWDSSNAESLFRYTKAKGYKVTAFEFGNELVGTGGIESHLTPEQYAADFCNLKNLVANIWEGQAHVPKLITPDNAFEEQWYAQFLEKSVAAGCPPDIVTWHQYLLGAGKDPNVGSRALDPKVLNQQIEQGELVQTTITSSSKGMKSPPEIWMGEAGGAYNSGRHLVTDAFHSSFWYLDGFGILSEKGHQTFCRQTLIGGHYGLLNTTTFEPNPDYYGLMLWLRLMSREVFRVNVVHSSELGVKPGKSGMPGVFRAYAHCTGSAGDVTLLLLNLANDTTFRVNLTAPFAGLTRDEYIMSANSLASQQVMLNGKVLKTDGATGAIPDLEPNSMGPNKHIVINPLTYGFFVLHGANVEVCE
jgi:heparanase